MIKLSAAKQVVGEYIQHLQSKGFPFKEDAIGFIYFGMDYTDADENLVQIAIEITLKVQKKFDGSFYLSLLESLKSEDIKSKSKAYHYVKERHLL